MVNVEKKARDENHVVLAEGLYSQYKEFCVAGFSSEQSFELCKIIVEYLKCVEMEEKYGKNS